MPGIDIPPNPLGRIDAEGLGIRDTATAYRLITSALGDVAGAGVIDEAAAGGVEVAASIAAAATAIIVGIVLLCVLVVFIVLVLLHNTVRSSVRSIPVVGSHFSALLDYTNSALMSAGSWLQDEVLSKWTGILGEVHLVVAGLISILGIPSISQLQHAIAGVSGRLARLPYDIDALENRVMKALRDSIASVWTNIHYLWNWVHGLLENVHALQNAVHQIWNWIHLVLAQIAVLTHIVHWLHTQVQKLWHETQILQREVNKAEKQIHQLQVEVQQLQHRVIADEAKLAPAAEAAAIMVLLSPLLDLGKEGIQTLTDLQADPCKCLFTPGSKGFMITSMVMYLWMRDGP